MLHKLFCLKKLVDDLLVCVQIGSHIAPQMGKPPVREAVISDGYPTQRMALSIERRQPLSPTESAIYEVQMHGIKR